MPDQTTKAPPVPIVDATAAGIRAWADLMGRASFRLRMTDTTPLGTAVADLLDEETQGDHGADHCPGRKCPQFTCPTELDEGFVDEDQHHHCRWCTALALSWEHPEPAAVRLARTLLEGGV
ncbi:hypothetical protein [Actinocrinis sp.]|uniref:hypothetical protein n=1 Tax=Actinocrinis sp. TaxID=1920516 RepID=UPI002D6D657E|nr:hypothetical protein [Actinocrinis sp.]HZP55005.1 hypothetical protein [Actinocrinis sp.]